MMHFSKCWIKILIIAAMQFTGISKTCAQIKLPFLSNDQKIIKEMADSAFLIVQQDYLLKSTVTNEIFGFQNNPFFGRVFSIGVTSGNDIYLNALFYEPWKYHKEYEKYAAVDTLKPLFSETHLRTLYDTLFQILPDSALQYKHDTLLLPRVKNSFDFKGIRKTSSSNNEGWMVILYTDEPQSNYPPVKTQYAIYRTKIKQVPGSAIAKPEKFPFTDTTRLLGGAFFHQYTSIGNTQLLLAGILDKYNDEWAIYKVNAREKIPAVNPAIEELVPVEPPNNSKKKKKFKLFNL